MARWKTTSHASTVRMSVPNGTRFSMRPKSNVPSSPPSAEAVVSRPKPASSIPTRSVAHSTSTDHGAAHVMLKATITRARVRTGPLAASHRTPSAMSWRTWVSTSSRTAPRGVVIRDTRTTPSTTHTVWIRNGYAMPAAKITAPSAGPTRWLAVRKPTWMRALATPRSGLSTSIGTSVFVAESANTSASPTRNIATMTNQMLTCSVTITMHRPTSTTARAASMTITSTRRSRRSAMAPARSPNTNHGSWKDMAAAATSSGLRVWEATSSGPAAIISPSPRLVAQDDATSQRKEMPSRRGKTVSTRRLTSATA